MILQMRCIAEQMTHIHDYTLYFSREIKLDAFDVILIRDARFEKTLWGDEVKTNRPNEVEVAVENRHLFVSAMWALTHVLRRTD